jgi:L-threonylcarbamoyladenylate synthase
MTDQVAPNIVEQAIEALRSGGVVIFPTDTAFAIGCRIDDQTAVDRLFALRKRPLVQATPVLVANSDQALAYFDHPKDIVRRYMKTYWPGALTIVSPCQKTLVYSPVRGGGANIGLRMPNHEVALAIIQGVGVPVLGPSANFHGDKTPYRFEDLDKNLCSMVDFVVPGVCSVGMASTVVDVSGEMPQILRQGSVHI